MSHLLGIAIESLVAVLLILTIGYCMLLNKRLKRLKADPTGAGGPRDNHRQAGCRGGQGVFRAQKV